MLNMLKNNRRFIAASVVLIVSCITIAGHFLLWNGKNSPQETKAANNNSLPFGIPGETSGATETGTSSETEITDNGEPASGTAFPGDSEGYVKYDHIETQINGNKQVINILEIKLGNKAVVIRPVLSFGLIYGFEELSAMAENSGAYAGVNGGFFSVYGEPAGMVMIDGKLCAKPTGNYPVFVTDGKTASFEKINIEMSLNTRENRQTIDKINTAGVTGEIVLYTPVYGTSNRAKNANITYIIENGKIADVKMTSGATEIPENGMLLTYYTPYPERAEMRLKIGESASFEYLPYLGENVQAYECGCMIVESARNVSPVSDPWIGVLTNRDPRTAIGIKDEGTVVLVTVDGRQPGYSAGMTAEELAEFLIGIGVKEAAMLDGGASTEMIVDGRIVNKPSHGGEERKIAGAVLIFRAEGADGE